MAPGQQASGMAVGMAVEEAEDEGEADLAATTSMEAAGVADMAATTRATDAVAADSMEVLVLEVLELEVLEVLELLALEVMELEVLAMLELLDVVVLEVLELEELEVLELLAVQVLSLPSSTGLTPPLLCPPPDQSQPQLLPGSPLPASSPYPVQTGSLVDRRKHASRPASPVRTVRRAHCPRPPPIPVTHTMVLRPSSVPQHAALPSPSASSLPDVPDPESHLAHAASPTVTRLLATDLSFESTAASALVIELVDFAATR
ncbi:unnamed protein product [Closterium sp. NIES-53]